MSTNSDAAPSSASTYNVQNMFWELSCVNRQCSGPRRCQHNTMRHMSLCRATGSSTWSNQYHGAGHLHPVRVDHKQPSTYGSLRKQETCRNSHNTPVLLQQLPERVPVASLLPAPRLLLLLPLLALNLLQAPYELLEHLEPCQPVQRLQLGHTAVQAAVHPVSHGDMLAKHRRQCLKAPACFVRHCLMAGLGR